MATLVQTEIAGVILFKLKINRNKVIMAKIILILTQDQKNESVLMLEQALKQAVQDLEHQVISVEINDICIQSSGIKISRYMTDAHYDYKDIALVIKITWSPIREKALEKCRALEEQGVKILNNCDFIEWSHSKIKQHLTLQGKNLLPKSVCYNQDFIKKCAANHWNNVFIEVNQKRLAAGLDFPIVFKTASGTRGGGIYLIKSEQELQQVLDNFSKRYQNYQQNFTSKSDDLSELSHGFLLQQLIESNSDAAFSTYLRINVVNGQAQSVMQFQMQWTDVENVSYKKIIDVQSPETKPVALQTLDTKQIELLINACPYKCDTVGIDAIFSLTEKKLYLLEYNDGPAISLIVNIAEKHEQASTSEIETLACQACISFPREIASYSKLLVTCKQDYVHVARNIT